VAQSYAQLVNPVPHAIAITTPPGGTPNPVASGATANLSVTATDSLSHTLNYGWSVLSCPDLPSTGSFNNAASRTPIWTAPVNATGTQKSCTIQVTVNDGAGGLSVAQSYAQLVNPVPHAIAITSGPGRIPPGAVNSGATANLSVTATDSLGHTLSYAWSVISCTGGLGSGSFNNAALRTPTWTAPVNANASVQSCTIQVTVSDGFAPDPKSVSQSYAQSVSPVGSFLPPTGVTATLTATPRQVHLVWTDNATTETRYQVQRCRILFGFCRYSTVASSLAANTNSYNSTVPSAGTYRFRVQACTATSCTAYGTSNNIAVP
jgi:hypothetical protein